MKTRMHLSLNCTSEQLAYIQTQIPKPGERTKALLVEANRRSGKAYEELTSSMSKETEKAFSLCPIFIGGDSTDIERFVVECWQRPVTDENHKEIAQLFRQWYKLVAPDEYHDPAPLSHTWPSF